MFIFCRSSRDRDHGGPEGMDPDGVIEVSESSSANRNDLSLNDCDFKIRTFGLSAEQLERDYGQLRRYELKGDAPSRYLRLRF